MCDHALMDLKMITQVMNHDYCFRSNTYVRITKREILFVGETSENLNFDKLARIPVFSFLTRLLSSFSLCFPLHYRILIILLLTE